MKPNRWLALSAACAGCAVAYGIYLCGQPPLVKPLVVAPLKSKTVTGDRAKSFDQLKAGSIMAQRTRSVAREEIKSVAASAGVTGTYKIGGAPHKGSVLAEAQWRANAEQVATEANHELNRLTSLLDLDSTQQNQVFSALAQKSGYWLPGMQAGSGARAKLSTTAPEVLRSGTAATTTEAKTAASTSRDTPSAQIPDVTSLLNADQEQALVQEEMDRQAWWEEVLPQLLPPTISDTVATVAELPPETKAFDGGATLLEE